MLEFEKKILITRHEYERLTQCRYTDGTAYVQTNYYYDTDDCRLNQSGITCRVRERDGAYKATVKDHQQKWNECSVENLIACNGRPDRFFSSIGLECQGSLKTERSVYTVCPGVDVIIDKNTYLDFVDYELEIEYDLRFEADAYREIKAIEAFISSEEGEQAALEFRKRIGKGGTKSERFIRRKSHMEKILGKNRSAMNRQLPTFYERSKK
jgi:uncharacterized protein YjbK